MKLTGAEIIVECLKEQNVDTVFGFPGGAVLYIYDALYKNKDSIRHILTSHEQGAAHAADGYARATGKTGVCIATSGPGATNLVTGIATAYMDSVPMVAITGNVPTALIGKDSFQEVDITGITMPITKHNYQIRNINELAGTIREAFKIAQSDRPGPVLIDIPKDITKNTADYEKFSCEKTISCITDISDTCLNEALDLIKDSKKPFIYAGGGVVKSNAVKELTEFSEIIKAPVACSLMGLGGIPGNHPNFTGMVGMHGTRASNLGVMDCDVLIVLGARFSDRVVGNVKLFAPNAQILHIDIDPAEVGKNVQTYHYIIGDIKDVLLKLNKKIDFKKSAEWKDSVLKLNEKDEKKTEDNKLTAKYILEKINEAKIRSKKDIIVATEVGQHQIWTAQYIEFNSPGEFITSGGLGTMGFGMGAAIGAQIGSPDKKVINIAGDGSFRMNLNELITASRYNLPVAVFVLNNRALGMVRQWQSLFYDKRYSQTTLDDIIDYEKLAESFGIKGYNLTKKEQAEEIVDMAIKSKRPVIVNCIIDSDENVFPMVAPGDSIDNLIME